MTMHNIATMAMDAGDTTDAIAQFERILGARDRVAGPDDPDNLPTLNNLAVAYWKTKQLDKSIPLFERLIPLNQKHRGEAHPDTIVARANLGVNYRDAGRLEDALPVLKQAYGEARGHLPLRWVEELLLPCVREG